MNSIKSSITSTGFVVEPSSINKTNAYPLLCYECACYYRASYMQLTPCVICKGRKCHYHGGLTVSTCKECGLTNMCWDCHAFGKCCYEFDGTNFIKKNIYKKK